jgi:hypothetical protein
MRPEMWLSRNRFSTFEVSRIPFLTNGFRGRWTGSLLLLTPKPLAEIPKVRCKKNPDPPLRGLVAPHLTKMGVGGASASPQVRCLPNEGKLLTPSNNFGAAGS